MSDDPAKPPRFPVVGALLCGACLGMAIYLWMRYSHAWDVSPKELVEEDWTDTYVRVRVESNTEWLRETVRFDDNSYPGMAYGPLLRPVEVWPSGRPLARVTHFDHSGTFFTIGLAAPPPLSGRVTRCEMHEGNPPVIMPFASRLHPASVAGLVVGAMGVFVFSVALRHWLKERRRFREETRGPGNRVERTHDA